MSITSDHEMEGMRAVSRIVGLVLRAMRDYARPGMDARTLDAYGGSLLSAHGARSAPHLAYGFPGWTCISVNEEIAHGLPSANKIFREGDLINIDVSAELNGFWADNGASFVLGHDLHNHQPLVDASQAILDEALMQVRAGQRIAEVGRLIELKARQRGFRVIRNLSGHGIGRSLHEEPGDILNWFNRGNRQRFQANTVVALETFIATDSSYAHETTDGWTLVGDRGGFVAQHEHTILITHEEPVVLTA